MGQKVNPISFRLGIVRDWDSRWYSTREDYAVFLHEDIKTIPGKPDFRKWVNLEILPFGEINKKESQR